MEVDLISSNLILWQNVKISELSFWWNLESLLHHLADICLLSATFRVFFVYCKIIIIQVYVKLLAIRVSLIDLPFQTLIKIFL